VTGIVTGVAAQTTVDNLSPAAEIASEVVSDTASAIGGAVAAGIDALTNPANHGVPDINEDNF
jgi:hypothetical protein